MNLAKTEPLTVTSRDTRERNLKALIRDLSKTDFINIVDPNDVNLSTNRIHELLIAKIDHHLPLTTHQINYKNVRKEPWLSAGLLRCIKRSKKLYSRSIRHNSTESDCLVYKDYCQTLTKAKRFAKKQYYEAKCVEYKHNTKKLWNVINEVCSKSNDKTSAIEYLKIDNIHEYKANKISNHLGKYFSSVGQNYANKIPKSSHSVHSYISKIPRNPASIMLLPVCEQEIERILTKLPAKCSSGHDNISNLLLKQLKTIVVPLLCKLSNASLSTGVFPDVMKIAEVVPLHKGKSPHDECNYRPISLLTTMSKILAKVVYSHVYGFLDSTGQIYDSQYGFRANHSCEHAVSEVVSEILKNNEQNKPTAGIFLDLSKAFDTLDHKLMLDKMEKYGIRGLALEWFASYLDNCTMRVKCSTVSTGCQVHSDLYPVEYGAPQGSCLGPLIFLIFVNDLHLHLELMRCIQFADDMTLLCSHKNAKYLQFCVEMELKTVQDWFCANKLTLNVDKTTMMVFGKRNTTSTLNITLNGVTVPHVQSTKFLGVWLDSQLNWSTHISTVRKRLQSRIGLLRRSKHFLSMHCLRVLYFAQIQSVMTYGIVVWGPMLKSRDLNMLSKLQTNCMKRICTMGDKKHLYQTLRVLPIKKLVMLEQAKLGYKLCNNLLPKKLSGALLTDQNNDSIKKVHGYDTRHKNVPNLPTASSTKYRNSFLCKAISTYSSLPQTVTQIRSLPKFVCDCKKYLSTI